MKTLQALRALFVLPAVFLFLLFINIATGGEWWIQWPALGLGIAWVISLFRVLRALVVVGGLAGLAALLNRR